MIAAIQKFVRCADTAVARLYLAMFHERDALMCFLFHSLFRDDEEISQKLVDPLQRTTVGQFRRFIEYYLGHGYQFVSPLDLVRGLEPGRKYALLSFDDGYFNNSRALPVLEEFGIPATFFISTDHVLQNKCFWWDVLYRERSAQGASHDAIYREALSLKSLRAEAIEGELTTRFGPEAFKPRGDIDRPFSPHELREFSRNPHVHLGNHTANHAILTNYDAEGVGRQIQKAQEDLKEMTGAVPIAIAYPNGGNDERTIAISGRIGLKVGFTVRPEKIPVPLSSESSDLLRLGRFATHGGGLIETQCRTYRSDFLLYGMFRAAYLRLLRGQVAQ